jgi:3-hydroxyisobutyrate dehydrogenase
VWARRADVAASHAKTFGSEVAPSLPALAEADVLFTCLPTSEDVAQVLDAVPLRGGTIVVDCTSGDPQLSKQLADDLAAHRGCWFVDAPVSGGVSGAEAG